MRRALTRGLHRAARRAARAADPRIREVVLALAGRSPDGPRLLPGPPAGPVLVVSAHPDDETIGAGGTLARHAARGDAVRLLVATSGEATTGGSGDVAAAREAECRAACTALGMAPPVFVRLPDGRLAEHVEDLAAALRGDAADWGAVYVPSLFDPHPDHRAVNAAVARAGLGADVYGFEVWAPGPVDVLVDVSAAYARKEAALRCYATALESVDYVRTAGGLAAYRSGGGGLGGRGRAEGFLLLDASEHAAVVARLASDAGYR